MIDKFSVDTNGNLLFNGQAVKADGIDFTALSGMLVQGDNITITPNTDSNTIIISATIPETGINFTELSSMLVQGENISIVTDESAQTITLNASGIDFTALSTAMTTGTLSGISITADTENSRFNFEVTGIPTIAIDSEGYWTINGERGSNPTKAQGEKGKDGASPTIDPNTKNWIIGTVDTGVKAEAQSNYFYTGTEFPTSDLIDGDLYLSFAEETKGNVYQYQELTLDWSLKGNLYGGGAVIDDTSTTGNTVTWSANKINSVVEDINTAIENIDNSGSGGSGGSIVITDSLPQSPDTNTLYKYTDINLGDLLMMYSNGHWRYSPLLMYPQKVFISPTEIYATGHVFGTTPANAISVVDISEPLQVGNLLATQALKISGMILSTAGHLTLMYQKTPL